MISPHVESPGAAEAGEVVDAGRDPRVRGWRADSWGDPAVAANLAGHRDPAVDPLAALITD